MQSSIGETLGNVLGFFSAVGIALLFFLVVFSVGKFLYEIFFTDAIENEA